MRPPERSGTIGGRSASSPPTPSRVGPSGPASTTSQHQCAVVMGSDQSADPSVFADLEWVSSPYRCRTARVMALVHEEYQGSPAPRAVPVGRLLQVLVQLDHAGDLDRSRCDLPARRRPSPGEPGRDGPLPIRADTGPAGVMMPSNIIRRSDGFYYVMVAAPAYHAQQAWCVRDAHQRSHRSKLLAGVGRNVLLDPLHQSLRRRIPAGGSCLRPGLSRPDRQHELESLMEQLPAASIVLVGSIDSSKILTGTALVSTGRRRAI